MDGSGKRGSIASKKNLGIYMSKAEEMRTFADSHNKLPNSEYQTQVMYNQIQELIEISARAGKYQTDILLVRIPKDIKNMDDALKRLSIVERPLRKLLNDDGFVVCMKDSLVGENFIYSFEIRWG